MILNEILVFLMKFHTILINLKIMIFGKFWWQNWKNVGMQNLLQNDEIWIVLH